jgi:hypothetical protein
MNLKLWLLSVSSLALVVGCKPPPEVCDDDIDQDENGLVDCDDVEACGAFPACQIAGQAVVEQANDINAQNANNATFSIFGQVIQKIDGDGDGTIDATATLLAMVASDRETICDDIVGIFNNNADGLTDVTIAVSLGLKIELGDVEGGFSNGESITGGTAFRVSSAATKLANSALVLNAIDAELDNDQLAPIGTFTVSTIDDILLTAESSDALKFDLFPDNDFDADSNGDLINDSTAIDITLNMNVTNAIRCEQFEVALAAAP